MADDVGTSGEGEQGELVKRSLHEAALQYCFYFGCAVNGEEDSGWGFLSASARNVSRRAVEGNSCV